MPKSHSPKDYQIDFLVAARRTADNPDAEIRDLTGPVQRLQESLIKETGRTINPAIRNGSIEVTDNRWRFTDHGAGKYERYDDDARKRLVNARSSQLRKGEEKDRLREMVKGKGRDKGGVGRLSRQDDRHDRMRIELQIDEDLRGALEGMPSDQKRKLRTRALRIVRQFIERRRSEGRLCCDTCPFDPAKLLRLKRMKETDPRSLLDVHHKHPLEYGKRQTKPIDKDLALYCPTCHRFEHARLRASAN